MESGPRPRAASAGKTQWSQRAAIGLDGFGHAVLFVGEGALAVRTVVGDGVGLGLQGAFDQLALQFQGAVADLFFDATQTLLGLLVDAVQASLEVGLPGGEGVRGQPGRFRRGRFAGRRGGRRRRCLARGGREQGGFHNGLGLAVAVGLANCGTRTQGRSRKRVLLATRPRCCARWAAVQPSH